MGARCDAVPAILMSLAVEDRSARMAETGVGDASPVTDNDVID